jgi:hypothetical protein
MAKNPDSGSRNPGFSDKDHSFNHIKNEINKDPAMADNDLVMEVMMFGANSFQTTCDDRLCAHVTPAHVSICKCRPGLTPALTPEYQVYLDEAGFRSIVRVAQQAAGNGTERLISILTSTAGLGQSGVTRVVMMIG